MTTLLKHLPVLEQFVSIQGEGTFIGTPALFLRLAGCNLRCHWCDTKESWSPSGSEKKPVAEIIDWVHNKPQRLLVITGGEPLLYDRTVHHLVEHLETKQTAIETAGTIFPQTPNAEIHYTVSPKLPSSGETIVLETVRTFRDWFRCGGKGEWKFVVADQEDLDRLRRLFFELDQDLGGAPLTLQPCASTPTESPQPLLEDYSSLIALVERNPWLSGFDLSLRPQLHKLLQLP